MKKLQLIITAILGLLLLNSLAWATEYYIDMATGNDGNVGTLSFPWKSIAKANNTLKAGDVVYLREGTYSAKIEPINSGLKDSPIIYSGYEKEVVTIRNSSGDGADLRSRSFVSIIGIQFDGNNGYAINLLNSSGVYSNIVIENCYFDDSNKWAHIRVDRVDYFKLKNNIFDHTCTATSPCGRSCGRPNGDHVGLYDSHYGLIEGNVFNSVSHTALTIRTSSRGNDTNCIIRNNIFNNRLHHAFELYEEASSNIIEKNIISNSGEDYSINYCGSDRDRTMTRYKHSALHLDHTSNNIIRQNLIYKNGKADLTTWYDATPASNNHIYNNTIDQNQWGWHIEGTTASYNNVFMNNIISNSISYAIYRNISGSPNNNYFINNNFYKGNFRYLPELSSITLGGLEKNFSSEWQDNMAIDPLYKDHENENYQLIESSPMIDAGSFLTVTTSTGTGSKIDVKDSGYFTDGLGIIEGDLIQLQGQTQTVRIIGISGNTIAVDRDISWTTGIGVSLPYSGTAPDIGAFEINMAGTVPALKQPLPPNNLRIVD